MKTIEKKPENISVGDVVLFRYNYGPTRLVMVCYITTNNHGEYYFTGRDENFLKHDMIFYSNEDVECVDFNNSKSGIQVVPGFYYDKDYKPLCVGDFVEMTESTNGLSSQETIRTRGKVVFDDKEGQFCLLCYNEKYNISFLNRLVKPAYFRELNENEESDE